MSRSHKKHAVGGLDIGLGSQGLFALLLVAGISCSRGGRTLSEVKIRQALDIYFPQTKEEKLTRLVAAVKDFSPEEQALFENQIQPWGGNLEKARQANEYMTEARARIPETFKRFREVSLPALSAIRYADEGVSLDQFAESLGRQYPSLDPAHAAAWRKTVSGLSSEQRELFDEYVLMLELGRTVAVGSGKRFAELVRRKPAAFKNFRRTLESLNQALGGQAQMQVKFDTYEEDDWVLRYLVVGSSGSKR